MWFFMITCYVLTALSFLMLFITGLQGYFQFSILNANHPTFALLTTIIYLFTQSLIIFFFVGTGVSIRDYTQEKKLDFTYRKRSLAVKRRVYPPLLLNMGLVMGLFISGGAVATHRLAGWIHGIYFLICLADFARVITIEHVCFKDETNVILEMSGVAPQAPRKA